MRNNPAARLEKEVGRRLTRTMFPIVDAETSLAVTLPPWAAVDETPARSATASNASVASAVERAMADARVGLAFF